MIAALLSTPPDRRPLPPTQAASLVGFPRSPLARRPASCISLCLRVSVANPLSFPFVFNALQPLPASPLSTAFTPNRALTPLSTVFTQTTGGWGASPFPCKQLFRDIPLWATIPPTASANREGQPEALRVLQYSGYLRSQEDSMRIHPNRRAQLTCSPVLFVLFCLAIGFAANSARAQERRDREPNSVYAARRARLASQIDSPIILW